MSTDLCILHYPKYQNIHYIVAIVDKHLYRVRYSFLQGLGKIALENTRADILIEDQLWQTVDQERELHSHPFWYISTIHTIFVSFSTGSRNGAIMDAYWNIWSLLIPKI